jgi:antirestriction protein ArdC
MMADAYQVITDRVITLLEQGVIPWQKPWQSGQLLPQNLISRKAYRGVNVFLLHAMMYESPYWLTFNQAKELGGSVRRGEKACPVVFWKWLDVDEDSERKRVPFLRYYSVFNVAQCEGTDAHVPKTEQSRREHNPIESGERIVSAMPHRPEIKHGLDRAYYSPSGDFVGMPSPGQFKSGEDYYSVLFHELTHSTGHESRLNRKGVSGSDGQWSAFGSQSYSKEELVAEMGAAFLCGQAGIVERTRDNSAATSPLGWLVSKTTGGSLCKRPLKHRRQQTSSLASSTSKRRRSPHESAHTQNRSCGRFLARQGQSPNPAQWPVA